MSMLKNTVSLTQFTVVGCNVDQDTVGALLALHAFRPIDNSSEETSTGWVTHDDFQNNRFDRECDWRRDEYVLFTMRRDQRSVPTSVLRAELEKMQQTFLQENPQYQRVPKDQKDQMREVARNALLARTFPTPSLRDVLWNTRTNQLWLFSTSTRDIDDFSDLFAKTFPSLRVIVETPLDRAMRLVPDTLQQALASATGLNQGEMTTVEKIANGCWLGHDFLKWLLWRSYDGQSDYNLPDGDHFVSYIDNKLVLTGEADTGKQRVNVTGPQNMLVETKAGLQYGKRLGEAMILFEKLEHQWKLTLKGELFQLASFKCPTVRLDKDANYDDEKLALFYERLCILNEGIELFDAIFTQFLVQRLGPGWQSTEHQLDTWLAA